MAASTRGARVQLEQIALKLRRRTAWEALDLGHAMLRHWARPAYLAWLMSFWIIGIASFALLWQWPWAAMLLLWWLKPVCDRVLLFTFSRSLFGNSVGWRDIRHAIPGLLRAPGLISGLTLRRFSMARSFLLPVWQLENQRDKAARARFKILARRTRGTATWLTFVCANMVSILWLGLILSIEFLLPVGSEGIFSWSAMTGDAELPLWKEGLSHLLWMVAESIVEPLYVASGFSLYLNRRSELEGWDIDVAFRRLATRVTTPVSQKMARASGWLLALTLGFCLWAPPQAVQAEPLKLQAESKSKQVITEILKDPIFGSETEEMRWRIRPPKEEKKEEPDKNRPEWLKAMMQVMEVMAEIMRVGIWIIAALAAAFLIYLIIRYRDVWMPGERVRSLPPEFLFGLDVRPESLPDDVGAAARKALAAGRIEEALSLLYRAALVALIHRLHVEFRAGDTEGDCLQRVENKLEAAANSHFRALLDCWRAAAYAHKLPSTAALEALCAEWETHFGTTLKSARAKA